MLSADPALSWNLVDDLRQLWTYPFMVNAFRAGTIAAVLAAVTGWFTVLRRQTFAAHSLSAVAFPGAAGATVLGASAALGYFASCLTAALVLALAQREGRGGGGEQAARTGTVQAFLLGCGFLFSSLYHGSLNGVNSLLFGSFLGITEDQVLVLLLVAVLVLGALAVLGRPLLFASVDPQGAAGRGVPVRLLSVLFLLLLGAAAAEAGQITGALLVFALLVLPAATAQQLTARPGLSLALAVLIALAVTWTALAVAYFSPYPIGFFLTSFAFAGYVLAHAARWVRAHRPSGATVGLQMLSETPGASL